MSVSRLTHITQIGVEQMGDLADGLKDPDMLRLENLDTDLRPPQSALAFTKRGVVAITGCFPTGARWRNGIKTPARIGEDRCDTDAPLGECTEQEICALCICQ